MKFKKLEIEQEGSWIKRTVQSRQARRSILFTLLGALASFLYFFFTEGKNMDVLSSGDVIKSLLVGGGFGFFITNSPCARGRC